MSTFSQRVQAALGEPVPITPGDRRAASRAHLDALKSKLLADAEAFDPFAALHAHPYRAMLIAFTAGLVIGRIPAARRNLWRGTRFGARSLWGMAAGAIASRMRER